MESRAISSRQSLWRETKSTASSKWPCNTSPTKKKILENVSKEHELDQLVICFLKSSFYRILLPENDQPRRKQVRVSPVKLRTQEQSVV